MGRADSKNLDSLRRLAHGILKRCSRQQAVHGQPAQKTVQAWPLADMCVLQQVWQCLGLPEAIHKALNSCRLRFNVERAQFGMVNNRSC